jgi:hypothetical protein
MRWSSSSRILANAHGGRNPSFPSGNSRQLDLHRLAIRFRFRRLTAPCQRRNEPRRLVPSDAQLSTIYALATPPGKAGVAVVRVSGPRTLDVWRRMVRSRTNLGTGAGVPEPWRMKQCAIVDPESEELLDEGLAVFFQGSFSHSFPRGYT